MKEKSKKIKLNLSSVVTALKKINDIRKEYTRVLFANAVLQGIRPFIPIILSAKILDELLGGKDTTTLMRLAFVLIAFMFVTHVLSAYLIKRYNDESKMLISHYYLELSKKSMKMDYSQIEKKETMDLLHQIEGASNSFMAIWDIAEYLQKGLLAVMEILISGVLIISMFTNRADTLPDEKLAFIQSPMAFVFLMVVLLIGLYLYSVIQGKQGETAARDMKSAIGGNRIFAYLFFRMGSSYENGKDIRLYNAQNLIFSKMKDFVRSNYHECDEHFVKPNIKNFSLLSIVNVVMVVAVYIFIILKAYVGAITVGSIFIQINAIMRLYDAVGSFFKQFNMLKAACEHFKYSINFFNLPEKNKEGMREVDIEDGCVFEFKNVSFKYPSSETLVLDNISLTLHTGERLAVVGMNGAGKTTMIKLLCRLYEPTEGIITLNGIDVNLYDYDAYIKLFSVVFQDFQLFSFDMDANVVTGETINRDKLMTSLYDSGLKNVVEELKGNCNVPMGKNFDEGGRDFSGGERQKLAIARALYRDAPVVILDEPTAALDPIAEYDIYTKFNSLVKNKSAVFISHRLSSCQFCHNIAVFDKGKIVQFGSHDSLVKEVYGKYHELWQAQAEHYVYD